MPKPRLVELPYHPDTGARFAAFASEPWSILLDSGSTLGQRGRRYDIFAAAPFVTLTTRGDWTEVATREGTKLSDENPFALLKRHLGPPELTQADLPFAGGAMGYFSYDLGRRLERLPSRAAHDIDMPEMAVGLYDWAVVVDHRAKRTWLVSCGRDARSSENWERVREIVEEPPAPSPLLPFRVLSPVSSNLDKVAYAVAFKRIKHYIREGDCYQVNLAQRFSARVEGDAWDAYRRLQTLNPAPFSAFMNLPDGAILSSSPERFLQVQEGTVETRPIKGTRPRSPNEAQDRALAEELRRSPKDQAENLMIVDLLRNDIGKNCAIGSVKVPKLFAVESFTTVHHLVSTITGRLAPGKHALDLLAGCFPGGSITGAPKLRAMEIIEELEPHRRSVYCGAIGYVGFDGAMDTNIAIRTLVYHQGWMHCWAGGGIVMDSEMEAEYQECLDKAAALLRLMENPIVERRSSTEQFDVGD
jgi:para-aminobenzoate synthetase component 1